MNAEQVAALRVLLAPTGWLDRAADFARALRGSARTPGGLLLVGTPDDEPWQRGNDRLHEKLGALGVAHTIDFTTSAGGHRWDYFNRMAEPALRFVAEGLDKESRRLL